MGQTRAMAKIVLRAWLVGALWMAATPLLAQSVPATAAVSPADDYPRTCNSSLYRFLPGEVNFCLAARDRGRGDIRGTLEMLKLAAGWGSKPAQYALGLMYFNGDQVPVDRPLGLAWLGLAAERGDRTYTAVFGLAWGKSSMADRSLAEARYEAMLLVYGDDVAARRAQRHFDRAMHELTRYEPYPTTLCIAGLTPGGFDGDSQSCPSSGLAITMLNNVADVYFAGWQGHVTVGDLQPVQSAGKAKPVKPAAAAKP